MGNEIIPDVVDDAPLFPLDLVYKTIRTFPGMKLKAENTRYEGCSVETCILQLERLAMLEITVWMKET